MCPFRFAGEAVLVPGDRVPVGHADLLERAARLDRPADDAHAQVLLLDRQPAGPHWDRPQGKEAPESVCNSAVERLHFIFQTLLLTFSLA